MIEYKTAVTYYSYDGLKYSLNNGPYYIVYFSENSTFMSDRDKLKFRQMDFRDIGLTNTNIPRVHINNRQIQEYRDVNLIAHDLDKSIKSKNIIVDSTVYIDKIDTKYKITTYQNRYGDMIYSYVMGLFSRAPIGSKTIFLYSMIDNTKNNDYTKNKFFVFLKNIKNNKMFFDDLLLCSIKNNKSTFKILIKDRQVEYEKVLYHVRNTNKR